MVKFFIFQIGLARTFALLLLMGCIIFSAASAHTYAALSASLRIHKQIISRQLVTIFAFRFGEVEGWRAKAASHIFHAGHGLKMLWVDTVAHSTKMIHFPFLGHVPYKQFISDDVSALADSSDADSSIVATVEPRKSPFPTSCGGVNFYV